ncbi:MAG: hypothetical protein ACYC63_09380 [Armatimonadota bacterium]
MPVTRRFLLHQQEMAAKIGDHQFSLIDHVTALVNEDGLTLSEAAVAIGAKRPTLEKWLEDFGLKYRVAQQIIPLPVYKEVPDGAGVHTGR